MYYFFTFIVTSKNNIYVPIYKIKFFLLFTSKNLSGKFHNPDDSNIASKSLYELLHVVTFNQKVLLMCQITINRLAYRCLSFQHQQGARNLSIWKGHASTSLIITKVHTVGGGEEEFDLLLTLLYCITCCFYLFTSVP